MAASRAARNRPNSRTHSRARVRSERQFDGRRLHRDLQLVRLATDRRIAPRFADPLATPDTRLGRVKSASFRAGLVSCDRASKRTAQGGRAPFNCCPVCSSRWLLKWAWKADRLLAETPWFVADWGGCKVRKATALVGSPKRSHRARGQAVRTPLPGSAPETPSQLDKSLLDC